MKVTVHDPVPASADVTPAKLRDYLSSSGWHALSRHSGYGSEGTMFGWPGSAATISVWDSDDAASLAQHIEYLARRSDRQPSAVLAEVAGHEILDRGTAINRLATAGARLVEAREAESRVPAHMTAGRELARARRQQAELDVIKAKAAVKAAEGGGR